MAIKLLGRSLCVGLRMGWKLCHPNEPQKERKYLEWAGTINPFCPYTGKWPDSLRDKGKQANVLETSKNIPKITQQPNITYKVNKFHNLFVPSFREKQQDKKDKLLLSSEACSKCSEQNKRKPSKY